MTQEELDRLAQILAAARTALDAGARLPSIAIKADIDETKAKTIARLLGSLCPNCKHWPTWGSLEAALGIDGDGTAIIHCIHCGAVLRVRQTIKVQHSIEQLEVVE